MRGSYPNPLRRLGIERLEERFLMAGDLSDLTIAPPEVLVEPPALLANGTASSQTVSTVGGMERFASAEELRQWLIAQALPRYESMFGQKTSCSPWMPYWGEKMFLGGDFALLRNGVAATASSATNTQVLGVDEADLVETDGSYLYIVRGSELVIVDVRPGQEMAVLSRISLGQSRGASMYLDGDRLAVLSPSTTGTAVSLFDIFDRASPHLVQRTDVPGRVIDSRVIDHRLYLVATEISLYLPAPQWIPDETLDPTSSVENTDRVATSCIWNPGPMNPGRFETKEQYLARIAGKELELGVPRISLYGADGQLIESRLVSQPTDIYRGADATFQYVSVQSFDLAGDTPGPTASVTVPGSGWTSEVFVSQQSIYLFQVRCGWPTTETRIVKFDLDAEGGVTLAASGVVPGSLLNHFSADEYQGYLRVATGNGDWWRPVNSLYVLKQEGDQLTIVGQLENLTPGERIYSARFLQDRAFVVTFRKTDPLLAIDLSDPTAPTLKGELVIPGFSNYLQLVDGRYLIGIGRDADSSSGLFGGPQISLFDVGDMEHPTLVDRYSLSTQRAAYTEAFDDHHAVSYFADEHILAMPVAVDGKTDLWVFRINVGADGPQGFELLGRIQHDTAVRRSLRIGEVLFSVSDTTVVASALDEPNAELGRLSFVTTIAPPVVDPPVIMPPVMITRPIVIPPVMVEPPIIILPVETDPQPEPVTPVLLMSEPVVLLMSEPVLYGPAPADPTIVAMSLEGPSLPPEPSAWDIASAIRVETPIDSLAETATPVVDAPARQQPTVSRRGEANPVDFVFAAESDESNLLEPVATNRRVGLPPHQLERLPRGLPDAIWSV